MVPLQRIGLISGHCAPTARFVSAYDTIKVEVRGKGVAVITLNRPKALNSLNAATMRDVLASVQSLDSDDRVRCMIITGEGEKAFAAGADIKEMNSVDFAEVTRLEMLWGWQRMREVRKPIIAAVNGFALGGGCELAMLCDIILASERAKFGQPEINLGTIPGMGGTQRLTRAVGKSKAMTAILSGRQFSAVDAERAGLVSRVVPHDQLLTEAVLLAEEIASKSQVAVAFAKEAVLRAQESSLAEGLLFERNLFYSTWAVDDRAEGMSAFTEKRPAAFKHR